MLASRLIALMFVIGFVGFLGSVFTGSYALAGVAGGFFAGATCAMAIGIVDKKDEEKPDEKPQEEPNEEEQEEPQQLRGYSKYGGKL